MEGRLFGRFWCIKVKKTAKSQKSKLGTVADGVKRNSLTASGVKESKRDYEVFKALKDMKVVCPKWLNLDLAKLEGKVVAKPQRDDIDGNIRETLIVEFYSK